MGAARLHQPPPSPSSNLGGGKTDGAIANWETETARSGPLPAGKNPCWACALDRLSSVQGWTSAASTSSLTLRQSWRRGDGDGELHFIEGEFDGARCR